MSKWPSEAHRRGEKAEIIKAFFTEHGLDTPVLEVVRKLGETGLKVSRQAVYNARNQLSSSAATRQSQSSFSPEELRNMREFIKQIGSLGRTKLLLATVEELSDTLPD